MTAASRRSTPPRAPSPGPASRGGTAPAAIVGQRLFAFDPPAKQGATLRAFDLEGGEPLWRHTQLDATTLLADHDAVYVQRVPGVLTALDAIEPTIDRGFAPGDASTISDHRDNIHWFEAQTDTAFIFNVHVTGYERTGGAPGRVYLDPHGEALPGGRIRAPRLTATECVARHGG